MGYNIEDTLLFYPMLYSKERINSMKALTYQGKKKVKVKEVADPKIEKKDDIIVRITSTAICGSDLHIFNGEIPGMHDDYVIGHEPMGIVEETGPDVTKVKKGDRIIIPFNVACGQCYFCQHEMESQCDNANDAKDTGGYLGYSDTYGALQEGKPNYCGFLMVISALLSFLRMQKWKMRKFFSYLILFLLLGGE